jgi:putative ABC transport system permease protein
MRRLRAWLRRIDNLFNRQSRQQELAREIEANLQIHIEDNVSAGMTAQEARRHALATFGGIDSTKEACRDRRGISLLDGIARDMKFAARMLRQSPLFTAVAVLSLALGIGANTTVFSIAYGALKGLPFKDADSIVYVSEVDPSKRPGEGPATVSLPDFLDIKQQSRSFTDLATFGTGTYNISDDVSTPERVIGSRVTMNLFSLVGQKPLLGRDFLPDDDTGAAEPVAIIGYGPWQNRYGGTPDVLGRSLRVNGVVHRIIGVMPRGMKFPLISEIWLPNLPPAAASLDRAARNTDVFGRLRNGVTVRQAEAELNAIAQRLKAEYPQTNKNIEIHVKPFAEQFDNRRNRNATWALIAAVCFVLLIVCANLANLLLARAVDRTRETAIRLAIGATRWQIIRQLLVESLLLSFAGGVLGLGLGVAGFRALSNIAESAGLAARLPFWVTISIDYHVYIYLVGICLVTGVLFGLAPALQISGTNANDRLKDGTAGAGSAGRSRRLTAVLVTSEIALTFTLLVAAGLMIRSIVKFQSLDTDPHTLVSSVVLSGSKYASPNARVAFLDSVVERLQSTPGLAAVTVSSEIPTHFAWGEVHTQKADLPSVPSVVVTPGYFRATGANILRGRDFDARDGSPESRVAIVNAQFASQQWPGEDPIGKGIRKGTQPDAPWLTIIGVCSNLQVEDAEGPFGAVYTPYRQEPFPAVVLITRSELRRDLAVKTLRTEVQNADPDLPLFNVMTMAEHLAQIGLPLKMFVWFFGLFGGLAFLMSVIGIYGVTAYSVAQRTREIGIRITLGATSHSVVWLVLRQGLRHLIFGLALGLAGAFGISRALAGMLFHTAPTDGPTYAIIFLSFVATTLAACLIPASRTAKVDPAVSLRLQ